MQLMRTTRKKNNNNKTKPKSRVILFASKLIECLQIICIQFPPPDYFRDYNKDPDIKRDMEEVLTIHYLYTITIIYS